MFTPDDDDEAARHQTFTRRAMLLGGGQLFCFGLVGARLYQIQVMDEGRYVPLAEGNRIGVHLRAPERGHILDRFGEVLASNQEGFRATLIPSRAGDLRQTLAMFARIVPLTADEQERIVQRAQRKSRSQPLVLAGDLSFEQVAELSVLAPRLPGIATEPAPKRTYFHGDSVGHVIGYVGGVERLALDDDPVLRLPGTRIGKSGIELGMEEELRGVAGSERLEVDARGRIVRSLGETAPRPGRNVVLTLDVGLQARVMARLGRERRGAVVAMDVNSGEVIALASVPAFDPRELFAGAGADAWKARLNDPDKPLLNRAISGLYPPGSTFKMVTALAALEAGVVTLKEKVECAGSFEFAGQSFRCWNRRGHNRVDLHRALKESCDVYFYELARRVGIGALSRMARRLGFGEVFESGIALQKAGVVPDPDWKRGALDRGWLGGETVITGIGQGFVTATPLQLAVMTARLATGRKIRPTLIRHDAGARPVARGDAFQVLDIAPEWLDAVRTGMVAAVNEDGGTASNAQLDGSSIVVAGKTGTSQVSRASSERGQGELPWDLRDHALFVGYAPATRPRYAAVAVVEHGGSGGAVAAPMVRDVLGMLIVEDPAAKPAYRQPDAERRADAAGRSAPEGSD